MEYVSAIVASIATIIVALRAFFTRFTFGDRARERIMRDIRLFNALPDGFEQQRLKENIEASMAKMLDDRERRERELVFTWAGGALVFVAIITVVLAILPDDREVWGIIALYLSMILVALLLFVVFVPIAWFIQFIRAKYAKARTPDQEALSPKS